MQLPVSAETANGVEAALLRILEEYPDGSYFTANGEACTHSKTNICNNCNLVYIRPELKGVLPQAWTCASFTRYVMYTLYGESTYNYSNTLTEITQNELKIGDFVAWPGYHYAIYLYSDNSKYYFYECNWKGATTGMVSYNTAHSSLSGATFWRAANYDAVNNGENINLDTLNERWQVDDAAGVNLRTGAGTGFLVVKALANGTIFDVTRKMVIGGITWGKCSQGWVALDYCKQITDEQDDGETVSSTIVTSNLSKDGFTVTCTPITVVENMKLTFTVYLKSAGEDSAKSIVTVPISDGKASADFSTADFGGECGIYNVTVKGVIMGNTVFTDKAEVDLTRLPQINGGDFTYFQDRIFSTCFAVSGKGIAKYKLMIDGTEAAEYTGTSTLDYELTYPQYDTTNCLLNLNYDVSNLSNGDHTAEVIAVENDGGLLFYGKRDFIVPIKLNKAAAAEIENTTYIYTGDEIKPVPTVTVDGAALEYKKDYTISYMNNTNTGLAKVIARGTKYYTGTVSCSYLILPQAVGGLTVKARTANSITVTWDKSAGGVLGYEVVRYNSATKTYVRRALISGDEETFYCDTGITTSALYSYKVRAFTVVNGKLYYGEFSQPLETVSKPATPVVELTPAKNEITVNWKGITKVSGYEVYCSPTPDGTFERVALADKAYTLKATISGLESGSEYYIKVRAYRVYNDETIYSEYSKTISASTLA